MVFQEKLAEAYDLIYKDKDYEAECDFIEAIFQNFASEPVTTILEGGCGTGGHAIPLAMRGYQVTGVDISGSMLKYAEAKARELNLKLDFQEMDLRQLDLKKRFDACLCLFAVMGYITETEDILHSLKSIRRHLNEKSLFIFDFWNGLAVLRILPSTRVKVIEAETRRIIRTIQPELDTFHHLCQVHYHTLITQDRTITDEFKETHTVRYFFPQEITYYLQESGFKVLRICPFLNLDGKVDENVWNITTIARAI